MKSLFVNIFFAVCVIFCPLQANGFREGRRVTLRSPEAAEERKRELKKSKKDSSKDYHPSGNGKGKGKGGKGKGGGYFDEKIYLRLHLLNQAFQQPFSAFFVMVHSEDAIPLYVRGENASEPLAILAEDGNPEPLTDFYMMNNHGVYSIGIHDINVPYFGGDTAMIDVETTPEYNLVTIATMAINTNDCFVAINGLPLKIGDVLELPGLDAGTEENNELCSSIPGPGCPPNSGNVRSGNGEGFIHVHRGFHGVGDLLPASRYDWRNPMMRVRITECGPHHGGGGDGKGKGKGKKGKKDKLLDYYSSHMDDDSFTW